MKHKNTKQLKSETTSFHSPSYCLNRWLCIGLIVWNGWACDDETAQMDTPIEMDAMVVEEDQEMVSADQEVMEGPPPHLMNPKAKVFLHDPVTDNNQLTEVELPQTTPENGAFTSEAVEVFNCLNEEGGLSGQVNFGLHVDVSLCKEEQVARPDSDGNYLSIEPPENFEDPNDQFAEVMMYYHVNQVFDYYRQKHDYRRYEEP